MEKYKRDKLNIFTIFICVKYHIIRSLERNNIKYERLCKAVGIQDIVANTSLLQRELLIPFSLYISNLRHRKHVETMLLFSVFKKCVSFFLWYFILSYGTFILSHLLIHLQLDFQLFRLWISSNFATSL